MIDYYKILNLSENASPDEIKSAYRRLAHLYHPDVNPSPDSREMFIRINEAYNYLMNKLNIENDLLKRGSNSAKETAQILIDLWIKNEREKVRAQANKYANYKFSRFRFTKIYRTTEFMTRWIAIGTFVFGTIMLYDAVRSTIKTLSTYDKIGFSYIASSFIIIFLGILIILYSGYKIFIMIKQKLKNN